jgi:hypothetical protein
VSYAAEKDMSVRIRNEKGRQETYEQPAKRLVDPRLPLLKRLDVGAISSKWRLVTPRERRGSRTSEPVLRDRRRRRVIKRERLVCLEGGRSGGLVRRGERDGKRFREGGNGTRMMWLLLLLGNGRQALMLRTGLSWRSGACRVGDGSERRRSKSR